MEIVSSRIFAAPRERVFQAFADPNQVAQWWGPAGFTNTIREFDLRPGGQWRFAMHGPDGKTYDNMKEFREVVPPERIVFRHGGPMHRFLMTMTYEPFRGGTETKLTWHMAFEPHPDNEKLKSFIVDANEQNFDRLAAHLDGTRVA